jgi:hypothetical protein
MSKASRLKGHCNRLYAICELPAHQVKTWWRFSGFGKGGFLVCMRGFFLLLAILMLFDLGMPPAVAAASSNASDQTTSTTNQQSSRCGATVADAVKQARLSLRNNVAESERAALACLIEAVSRLNTQAITKTRGDGDVVLSVPSYSGPTK